MAKRGSCALRRTRTVSRERLAALLRDAVFRADTAAAARRYAEGRSWPASLEPVFDLYRSALPVPVAAGDVSTGVSRQTGASVA